ncbi:MAG: tetratricopeptide repeat protein [Acidobacteriota bacterium]
MATLLNRCGRQILPLLVVMLLASTLALAQGKQRELSVQALPGSALDGKGKLWAVVIGVSTYKNLARKEQLEYAHRDAEAFAAFLRSPGGGGFPSSQLTLLTNQAATLSAIRSALGTTLPRSVEPDDMVIIYFAGHGVVEGEHDGYLLAHDSDPQNLYATALQLSELNRIISDRLKARNVILIADACHSGQLGWNSRGAANTTMVSRYLDEVGKSGKGVFRLLGSRADQRSYEDKQWGGGHGCFTWFLLEGLKGNADRDKDGFVRMGELLEFLSDAVPKATNALQHPRGAGDIDVRLPLAVTSVVPATAPTIAPVMPAKPDKKIDSAPQLFTMELISVPKSGNPGARGGRQPQMATLEVRGEPGLEVYLDRSFQGRVSPKGVLVTKPVKAGEHEVSIGAPNTEPVKQKLSLSAAKMVLNVKRIVTSPLVAQIKQALNDKNLRGAFDLYQQLAKESPQEQQRAAIEASLSSALEAAGQNAINFYVQSSGVKSQRGMFHTAAEAFRLLKLMAPNADQSAEAKLLFCEGNAKFEDNLFPDAIERFNQATKLDPRAAYSYNALGMACRSLKKDSQAIDAFKRAAELAPSWALPQFQLGLLYRDTNNRQKAREAFQTAARIDPNYPDASEQLMFIHLLKGEDKEAEQKGKEIISKFPNSGLAHLWLGQIYEESNRWALAAQAYEKGLALPADINQQQRADFEKRLEKCRKKVK